MKKSKRNPIIVSPKPVESEKTYASNSVIEQTQAVLFPSSAIASDEPEKKTQNGPKEESKGILIEEEIDLYELIMDRVGDSKTHGISNIVKAKSNILRVIWIVCFLASAAYCVYECVVALIVYFQYPVTPTSSPIYEAPSIFPSVDVCNVVPYDAVATASFIANISAAYNISASNYANPKDYTTQFSTLIKANLAKLAIQGKFDQFNNGFNLPDMSCFFEATACNISQFYFYQNFNYGNCFSFNMGQVNNVGGTVWGGNQWANITPILPANFAGEARGFQLEMYTGSPDNQKYSANNGLRVMVHNQSLLPVPTDDGIDVPTHKLIWWCNEHSTII